MLRLNPFIHDERFTLESDLQIQGSELIFDYILSDPSGAFALPPQASSWSGPQISRALALWERTCFEAFLQPVGRENYYEFNFSCQPAWNAFAFTSYRAPQPLRETTDFAVLDMSWGNSPQHLRVKVENRSPYRAFQVGLTAVLQEKNQNKHYCSLAHKGAQPDFHRADGFILLRGV